MNCRHLKVGDRVIRNLGGAVLMEMEVTHIDGAVITCAAVEGDGLIHGGWTFDAECGGEIDHDLGWNPPHTPTGSVLVEKKQIT